MTRSPWWMLAYRTALWAFPAAFRQRWGADMRHTFADRVASATEGSVPVRLIVRELSNVVVAGLRERAGTTTRRARLVHGQDIRYALRLLGRSPGFSFLTVLVLAGGLGLSTFTFSFLHTAMIRALPLSEGDRIVRIDPTAGGRIRPIDAVDVRQFLGGLRSLTEVGAYGGQDLVVGQDGDRRVIDAAAVNPVLFAVARVPPLLGRTLIASDALAGAEPVIVLSYRSWEIVFGADRSVVDRQIVVNGVSTRVVGVMPERFGFPIASEAWLPVPAATYDAVVPNVSAVRLAGRLAPGVTRQQAAAEATAIFRQVLAARDPALRPDTVAVSVESFPAAQIGEERTLAFLVLNTLAALILGLALVNVTNLLLARVNERARETAVRMALGASPGRLAMQGMWETIMLCLVGGVLGTAAAAWGLEAITDWTRAHLEGNLAFWWVWRMDRFTVLGAGGFVTVAVAILGAVVARQSLRTDAREVMSDGGARGGSRRAGRLARGLVMVQVATVTVLMFFGAMSGVVAHRFMTLDFGYDVRNVLQGGLTTTPGRYATPEARAAVVTKVYAALASREALEGVHLRRTLADRQSASGRFALRAASAQGVIPAAHVRATLGELATEGVTIVEGRALGVDDNQSSAAVVLVSRSLANRYWPGRSPVGDQIRLAGIGDTTVWRTIVGVTSDVRYGDPLSREKSAEAIYVPLLQHDATNTVVVVRARATEIAGRAVLMDGFGEVDPLLVPDGVQPSAEVLRKVGFIARSVSTLFAGCFAFALLLAVVGTYGLMARSIGLRRSEIGIRRALGATDATVGRLLLGQGARQLGVGTLVASPVMVVVGLGFRHFVQIEAGLAIGLGVGVALAIVTVVLAATWVPTRRALQVSPRDALLG